MTTGSFDVGRADVAPVSRYTLWTVRTVSSSTDFTTAVEARPAESPMSGKSDEEWNLSRVTVVNLQWGRSPRVDWEIISYFSVNTFPTRSLQLVTHYRTGVCKPLRSLTISGSTKNVTGISALSPG